MVSTPPNTPSWRRWFVPASLLVSAALAKNASWDVGIANRLLLTVLPLCWLALFLPSEKKLRIPAAALAVFATLSAIVGVPGPATLLLFTATVAMLGADLRAEIRQDLVVGLGVVAAYTVTIASGILLLFDHLYGRNLSRLASVLQHYVSGMSQPPESPTLHEIVGPWLILWTALVLVRLIASAKSGLDRRKAVLRHGLLWLVPVLLTCFVFSSLILIVSCVLLVSRERPTPTAPQTPRTKLAVLPLFGIAVFVLAQLASAWGLLLTPPKTIAIAPIGLGTSTAEFGPPAKRQLPYEANFTRIVGYLESNGFRVVRLSRDWKPSDLEGVDTALFINQQTSPTDDQLNGLYDRVRQGLRLVAVGDHTNIMGVRKPSNRLLSKVQMRLGFDSAMPFTDNRSWTSALWRDPRFQATQSKTGNTEISVGASILAVPTVHPLVVGMRGFADAGNVFNRPGGLGNMSYDAGEPIFGIPLATETGYGQGTVVAFGDTSSFQDTALTVSGRFVIRALSKSSLSPDLLVACGWISLAGVLLALFTAAPTPKRTAGFLFVAATVSAIGYFMPTSNGPEPKLEGTIVYDSSLKSRYPGFFEDEATDRVSQMVWRQRRQLVEASLEDAIQQRASAILISAPTVAATPAQIEMLHRYVEDGGNLILVCGHQSFELTRPLLAKFGCALNPTPLGGEGETELVDPTMKARAFGPPASPVDFQGKLLIDSCEVTGPGKALTQTFGRTTSLLANVGRGQLFVVGDDTFCASNTLGQTLDVNLDACRFLYEILDLAKNRRD